MKKFIVETYYTCTFKTIHSLDNLNDQEMSKIDNRKDGEVEVIDVKLNNRKTRKSKNHNRKRKRLNQTGGIRLDNTKHPVDTPKNNKLYTLVKAYDAQKNGYQYSLL